MDCHAVFTKMARNDGGIYHFESLQKATQLVARRKPQQKISNACHIEISTKKLRQFFLNLWILRCAQYDKESQYDKKQAV